MRVDLQTLKNKAIEISKESPHRIKMGAAIFKGKRLISLGYNHPLKSAKHLHPRYQRWKGSIHAEVDAILKAKTDLTRCSIIVVRVNRFGIFRTAKPCERCLSYIEAVGIKKVYYTSNYCEFFLEEISL
jgi:deoxycytidylate deaminase